jgi:dienelactone hydrolase
MRRLILFFISFTAIGWFNALMAQDQFALAPSLPARIEIHALPTQTLSAEAFLTGSGQGKSHILAAELKIPQGKRTKFPAVILMHGSGGIGSDIEPWTHALNAAGFATLVVDSFSGRGITNTIQDQTQLNSLAMVFDGYRALNLLSKHPRIDASKISIMGFSKGAVASIFSASTRFTALYGGGDKFASHIGLYTPCNTRVMGDTDVTGAPMRFFHGTTDDYVSVKPCRIFVSELKAKGVDATLTEFDNTEHAYDVPMYPGKVPLPQAQSTRNCLFVEKNEGRLINADTGAPFSYSDSCIETGAHIGYNPDSTAKTVKSVIEFLKSL